MTQKGNLTYSYIRSPLCRIEGGSCYQKWNIICRSMFLISLDLPVTTNRIFVGLEWGLYISIGGGSTSTEPPRHAATVAQNGRTSRERLLCFAFLQAAAKGRQRRWKEHEEKERSAIGVYWCWIANVRNWGWFLLFITEKAMECECESLEAPNGHRTL